MKARESGEDAGWWAIDVAGYLLTRIDALRDGISPSQLNKTEVVQWIRDNEQPWAPGLPDPIGDIPWATLRSKGGDAELVEYVLEEAVLELEKSDAKDARRLAARRFIPEGTLRAFGLKPLEGFAGETIELADGHVHQGAALPLEVSLRWIALSIDSIERPAEFGVGSATGSLADTTRRPFNPLPLLLAMKSSILAPGSVNAKLGQLAADAAAFQGSSWDELSSLLHVTPVGGETPFSIDEIVKEKKAARAMVSPACLVFRLRVEAILLAALTQPRAGLDVFVELFSHLSGLRGGRLPKPTYFRESINTHFDKSNQSLKRLELRMGAMVGATDFNVQMLEGDYADALAGYRDQVGQSQRPLAVTFPMSLVKSVSNQNDSDHWRFNPRGIFSLTESLLELMKKYEPLQPFVDGIDVAGLEELQPNWLFSPAFERFATATSNLTPRPACRFHAGEWQWTPLHGLRRVSEFLQFPLPIGTPRRVGHGLAIDSSDWRRLGEQPLDELLDDLIWALIRIKEIPCAVDTRRALERLILDLRRIIYKDPVSRSATADELTKAYQARFDIEALVRVSFLDQSDCGYLSFPDKPPATRTDQVSKLLVAHLSKGRIVERSVGELLSGGDSCSRWSVSDLHTSLLELYDLLRPELVDDLRWGGVVIESCPTSNVLIGGLHGYSKHPLRGFVDSGLLSTINTDDPSLFHAWMPDELRNAEDLMGVPARRVRRARELGLKLVAPGLNDGNVRSLLDDAIDLLERQPVT